ncbi:MAG: 3-hydroxyisobutyrate dehydrogenase [Polyangiales bacterium]|jgi:3-hydroxyisobutyrate dehydrogenase
MRRAFIGTGLIGAGLAEASLRRGDEVHVWNRTASKTVSLVALGATAHSSAGEAAAAADFIHVALTSDDAVDFVLPGIAAAASDEAVLIDHSTTSAQRTKERQAGWSYALPLIDAPIFMSPAACRAGTGVIVVAGPKHAYEKAEAALAPMSGKIVYLGEEPGRAAAMKLVGNGLILSLVGGLADAFTVGAPHGLAPSDVLGLFEHFDLNWVLKGRGAKMASGDFETSWSLKMARKDIGLMLDAAGEAPLTVLPAMAERADFLIAKGEGDRDVGVLACDVHTRDNHTKEQG